MNLWQPIVRRWRNMRLRTRFNLAMSMWLTTWLVALAIGYMGMNMLSAYEREILFNGVNIQHLSLQLDGELLEIQHLQHDILLNFAEMSESNLLEVYNNQADTHLLQALNFSTHLRSRLITSDFTEALRAARVDQETYLATVDRCIPLVDDFFFSAERLTTPEVGQKALLEQYGEVLYQQLRGDRVLLDAYVTLREAERQYQITHQVEWVERFTEAATALRRAVVNSRLTVEQRQLVEPALQEYSTAFEEVHYQTVNLDRQVVELDQLLKAANESAGLLRQEINAQIDLASRRIEQATALSTGLLIGCMAINVLIALAISFSINRVLGRAFESITQALQTLGRGVATVRVAAQGDDELGALGRAFNALAEQAAHWFGDFERRLDERTQAMKRHATYLETSAEVGRVASSILDPDVLIRQVVDLIRERFGLYYVGLYWVEGQWAILKAGTGEAGKRLLERNERIALNYDTPVGWCFVNKRGRVLQDTAEVYNYQPMPELPDTRSEAALPLRVRGEVIGALTVQHNQPGALNQDAVSVLQMMADQIAVALENARLFASNQQALDAARRAYGEVSREAWARMLRRHVMLRYWRDSHGEMHQLLDELPVGNDSVGHQNLLEAVRVGETIYSGGATVVVPVKIRENLVGALRFHKSTAGARWSAEEILLLESLTSQLGDALESARLYQDTQRLAYRERLVGDVTSRIRQSLDLETVLQTAADEIRRVLSVPELSIRLTTQTALDEEAEGLWDGGALSL